MHKHSHTHNFLDTQEILMRVQNNDIPSTWYVFRTSQKKLGILIFGFCGIICFIMAFLASYLLVNFDHHPTIPSNALYIIIVIMFIFIVSSVFISTYTWMRTKNVVLVLMSEGFVHGDSKKLKAFLSVLYKDIAAMYIDGNSVLVHKKKARWGQQQMDCRLFECSTQEVASTLLASYDNFKNKSHISR